MDIFGYPLWKPHDFHRYPYKRPYGHTIFQKWITMYEYPYKYPL